MKIPSDLEILKIIHRDYYDVFVNYSESSRSNKNYVPINIQKIANELGVDGDIVFGRLYYHLEEKYSYQKQNNAWVHFFEIDMFDERHVINFPLLSSVLSGLIEEDKRNNTTTFLSVAAIIVSLIALFFNINA